MKTILKEEILTGALQRVKKWAMRGEYHGQGITAYMQDCMWFIDKYECMITFTRDVGHHTSGWWKNPDYERCYHLSISFRGGRNKNAIEKILDGLFWHDKKKIWIEPPYSEFGKSREVWHYRLFCDQFWQPIKPRGEVYNTEFTEAGWKTYSEVQSKKPNVQSMDELQH